MGTVFQIPWTYIPAGEDTVDLLHSRGFIVISMVLTDDAVPVNDPILKDAIKEPLYSARKVPGSASIHFQKAIMSR